MALQVFGSNREFQRTLTLFDKLAAVYVLATANRTLCQHEIALLSIRCYSLGCFFPVNFPNASVKPKLHVLTHHFSIKAQHEGTVGMETEQLVESMHPFFNRKERQYASVRDHQTRMTLLAQSQWVASSTSPT